MLNVLSSIFILLLWSVDGRLRGLLTLGNLDDILDDIMEDIFEDIIERVILIYSLSIILFSS